LPDFSEGLNQVKSAAGKSASATDISGVSSALREYQGRYSGALDQAGQDYANLNKNVGNQWSGVVNQAEGYLPMYDAATNRAEALALGNADRVENAGLSATGAGRNLGSYGARLALQNAASITVPLEQAKIQQRYTNLDRYAVPAITDMANRETQRIGTFNPMVAQQQFQSGQATENTIQQLAMQAANMSYDNAVKYMNAISVPAEIQQRILSGQISQAGGLSQLYSGDRYLGLQDKMGTNVTPSQYYSFTPSGYPSGGGRYGGGGGGYGGGNRYSTPSGGTSTGSTGSGLQYAPAGAQGDWVPDAGNNRWQNWRTGAISYTNPNASGGGSSNADYQAWLAQFDSGSSNSPALQYVNPQPSLAEYPTA
ncbi:MAG TPA: hypothetical protein VMQ76_00230, partial [Terracidiphilus sp.]|nr:hypothetical protein [Terracidiphilus sp.]